MYRDVKLQFLFFLKYLSSSKWGTFYPFILLHERFVEFIVYTLQPSCLKRH